MNINMNNEHLQDHQLFNKNLPELQITYKQSINFFVASIKKIFDEENNKQMIIKASGLEVENALKVVQLAKESMGGIHSLTRFHLGKLNSFNLSLEDPITDFEDYQSAKKCKPYVTVLLSSVELDINDPGYQKPSIRIEPIFYAPGKSSSATSSAAASELSQRIKKTKNYNSLRRSAKFENKENIQPMNMMIMNKCPNDQLTCTCPFHYKESMMNCGVNNEYSLDQMTPQRNYNESFIGGHIPYSTQSSAQSMKGRRYNDDYPSEQNYGRGRGNNSQARRYNDFDSTSVRPQQNQFGMGRGGNKYGLDMQLGISFTDLQREAHKIEGCIDTGSNSQYRDGTHFNDLQSMCSNMENEQEFQIIMNDEQQ